MGSEPFTVLIVDDQPTNVQTLTAFLEDAYTVHASTDPFEVSELVHRLMPDIILMDIMMPGINGVALAESLKKSAATNAIPIIFVSALNQDSLLSRAREIGEGYVTKPVDFAILARIMDDVLNPQGGE
jgi:putative two-component system response regulator